mmetsp:Transcript_51435/g.94103  ORF Transcript_51435/g.94103 Transcript_51435/m.94103 type:complete len:91 (+) Transcript_51435:140-412(+)
MVEALDLFVEAAGQSPLGQTGDVPATLLQTVECCELLDPSLSVTEIDAAAVVAVLAAHLQLQVNALLKCLAPRCFLTNHQTYNCCKLALC